MPVSSRQCRLQAVVIGMVDVVDDGDVAQVGKAGVIGVERPASAV